MAHIHGFTPYFWTAPPANFRPEDCGKFRSGLNDKLKENARGEKCEVYVLAVEVHERMPILGYHNSYGPFLKVIQINLVLHFFLSAIFVVVVVVVDFVVHLGSIGILAVMVGTTLILLVCLL